MIPVHSLPVRPAAFTREQRKRGLVHRPIVSIVATNPATGYTGGRYHALMLAEALAVAEYDVRFVTNHRPAFYDEFSAFPSHRGIQLCLTADFRRDLPAGPSDLVVVVPGQGGGPGFYCNGLKFARRAGARIALLNFEDGAWFNSLSPEPRDLRIWDNWLLITRFANLVLSSTRESSRHAKQFYANAPASAVFADAYPSINTVAADLVSGVARENRVLVMSRFAGARHKGSHRLAELLCPAMRDHTIVLVVGAGEVPVSVLADLQNRAAEVGAHIEVKRELSDEEKFRELKRARLMLFPSMFEGFGYPPVEAQYCNTPCIAFDLPVLREHSGPGLLFVERGNWDAYRARIQETLAAPFVEQNLRARIEPIATLESFAQRLEPIVRETLRQPAPDMRGLTLHCAIATARWDLRHPRAALRRLLKPTLVR